MLIKELKFGLSLLKEYPTPRIIKANLATTFRCNSKCQICSIWKMNGQCKKELELTASEIDKIIERNRLLWVSFTGGEPFLNNEIEDILKVSGDKVNLISIVTNGSQPDLIYKGIKESINKKALVIVDVSIEGREGVHDQITGISGSYIRAIETIELLKSINSNSLKIGIEHTLSSLNLGEYKHIEYLAKKIGISYVYTAEQNAGYYKNEDKKIESPELPNHKFGLNTNSTFNNIFIDGVRKHKVSGCVAGQYSIFIDPYGTIYPCLFNTPTRAIGYLRGTNYKIKFDKKMCNDIVNRCKKCWTPCEQYITWMMRPWKIL